jgi:hypothetical protein
MTTIIKINFDIIHNQSAWECLEKIQENIGVLSNNLKTQILDIMGYGDGFTPGLHALRNGEKLLIQYNNYSVSRDTHTIEINLTEDLAIYREILKGSIHQFAYGNYFKLDGNKCYQIIDSEFNVLDTFDFISSLNSNSRYQRFYKGVQNGIFDTHEGTKTYLHGKLIWDCTIQTGSRKGEQLFLLQCVSFDYKYYILDCNGDTFETETNISSFESHGDRELTSFSVDASSEAGSILIDINFRDINMFPQNRFMLINKNGIYEIETDLIIHSKDNQIYAYHPRITDKYGCYNKVCLPTTFLDTIDRDYDTADSHQLFGAEVPQLANMN